MDVAATRPDLARRPGPAELALRLILLLLLLNIAGDLLLRLSGRLISYDSVVPLRALFEDYFRLVISFPGGERVDSASAFLSESLREWHRVGTPPGAASLQSGKLTHFHAPPVVALIALVSVRLAQWIEPALLYAVILLALFGWWARLCARVARSRPEWRAWLGIGLFAYPVLIMATRGNVYAGLTALCVIHALLLAIRGNSPRLAAILLAVAVCVRPNAIIFAIPLVVLQRDQWRMIGRLAIAGPAIWAAAMFAAHLLYPDYGPATFLAGVKVYYQNHVVQHWGVGYGSSLYGALVLLGIDLPRLDLLATVPASLIAAEALWLHGRGRLDHAAMLFLIAASYCLGTAVFADYHLLIFALPLMMLSLGDGGEARCDRIVLWTCALMLAPKNYLVIETGSIQPILNPLVLLCACAAIFALALRGEASTVPRPALA